MLDYIIIGIVVILFILAFRAGFFKKNGSCEGCRHAASCHKNFCKKSSLLRPKKNK